MWNGLGRIAVKLGASKPEGTKPEGTKFTEFTTEARS
jgi:hypothetical protein